MAVTIFPAPMNASLSLFVIKKGEGSLLRLHGRSFRGQVVQASMIAVKNKKKKVG